MQKRPPYVPNRSRASSSSRSSSEMLREGSLCVWFALVALAFWGTSLLGPAFPASALTAVYGLFLLACVAATVLRLLRPKEKIAASAASQNDAGRRGGPVTNPSTKKSAAAGRSHDRHGNNHGNNHGNSHSKRHGNAG